MNHVSTSMEMADLRVSCVSGIAPQRRNVPYDPRPDLLEECALCMYETVLMMISEYSLVSKN